MTESTSGPACAIIVAAGRSERMGGGDKVFWPLMGRPLLAWTLRAFKACDAIDNIVIVTSASSLERMDDFVREWRFDTKIRAIVAGGDHRQESVRAGIDACPDAAIVAVHDAARPLVTPEIITRGVDLARTAKAAICAVPSRDTIKQATGEPPVIQATIDRTTAWLAQTPQCFDRALLLDAHSRADGTATDDAALVEAIGHPVTLYEGAWSNLKVTSPEDIVIAEALLRERFSAE